MADHALDAPVLSLPQRSPERDEARLERAAWAYTTRRVERSLVRLIPEPSAPRAGDLVLARVDSLGFHAALQLPDGRRRRLFLGDEIVVAYGNRYAPNQFEAAIPRTLGPCQLVAGGGVCAKVLSWHASMTKGPTQITPLAPLGDAQGTTANLERFALPPIAQIPTRRPPIVAVVGTSMDSGKTTTAAFMVRGLTLAGLRIGYAKITGTGSGGDAWLLKDAGANPVLDFTDAGFASTYMVPTAGIRRIFTTLVGHLAEAKVQAIVLEVADGVLQGETAALLKSDEFHEAVNGIVFTAGDAMGALAGESWLRAQRLPLIALSGLLTASPLSIREALKASSLPVFSRQELARPKNATGLLAIARARGPRAGSTSSNGNGNGNGSGNGNGHRVEAS